MPSTSCPFCPPPADRVVATNELAVAIRDGYPVSPGHTLVIPQRHVASLADVTIDEAKALWELLAEVRARVDAELRPDGYNVGVTDGRAAGQTVMHLHVHLIPRFDGDRPDPRGGVRWVIPEKADYWSERG
jgi:diadenosine tetraphosphate (Ap4A) HIT family hydrolase